MKLATQSWQPSTHFQGQMLLFAIPDLELAGCPVSSHRLVEAQITTSKGKFLESKQDVTADGCMDITESHPLQLVHGQGN